MAVEAQVKRKVADVPTIAIGEACFVTDGAHAKVMRRSSGILYLTSKNIGTGHLKLDNVDYIAQEDYDKLFPVGANSGRRLRPGDVLIGIIGTFGNAYRYRNTDHFGVSSAVAILRPDSSRLDSDYLYYVVTSETFKAMHSAVKGGSAQGYTNIPTIRSLRIPLPPLATQRKIAAILSAYDDLIENNTRRIAILESMAQMLYREWFVHFRFPGHATYKMIDSPLGPIPEGWQVVKLGTIAHEMRRGVNPDEVDPEMPYVGLEHLPRKSIALSEWGRARDVQSTKLRFNNGDILFGKIRPYFHKVAVAPVDGVCSTDAIVIVPNDSQYFPLVLACVSSDDFVKHATQTSQGTKMPRANWDILIKYPVVVPTSSPLERFNDLVLDVVGQLRNIILRNANLRRTRDLLLPKLISGEVDVEDLTIETTEREGAIA